MDDLKKIIIKKVFDNTKIREISNNSDYRKGVSNWIMNFKSVSLDREFLSFFCIFFNDFYKDKKIQIGGMESGALPFITALTVSNQNNVNSFYIRKSRKKHDLANIYEGEISNTYPIVLIDDILNTGSTFLKQVVILESQGFRVSEIFVILKYRDLSYYKELTDRGIKINYIFELDDFKEEIGLENLKKNKPTRIPFNKYRCDWAIKLAEQKSNMYLVIPKSGICHDDDYIYTGADDGSFYCVQKSDGAIVWRYKITFGVPGKNIFSTPCLSQSCVFFGAYDGNFYCLDKTNGSVKWVFFDADYIGSSPWVENNKYVYIGLEFGFIRKKGGVAKILIESGKIVWGNYEMYGLTHASPVSNIKLNVVVCGCNDHFIYCFDRANGELIWKYKTNGEVKYGVIFDEKRKLVIAASMDGGVYCINVKNGELWYKFEAIYGFYSTPVMDSDNIYIGSLDKRIYCFDIKNKEKKWEVATAGRIFASPSLYNDRLYIGSNDGNLYEIESGTGEIISRTIISERIVNKIIVTIEKNKKILYIKSFTNELFKFIEN